MTIPATITMDDDVEGIIESCAKELGYASSTDYLHAVMYRGIREDMQIVEVMDARDDLNGGRDDERTTPGNARCGRA